ncbi:MAG TPA: HAD-IA family hydrolase [Candidatus Limnocylindria bacterium]|jgi:putative hydrolase of the HAD superfamily|nr:HAD-IA family hydrolase [Candidatus Limnocylindria bacterium]
MTQAVKAISFDVGGTLIRPHPSVGSIYSRVAERQGFGPIDPDALDRQFAAVFRQRLLQRYSEIEWRKVVELTFAPFTAQATSNELFAALWQEFVEPPSWQVFTDVVPALERCRAAGIRLAVTSNWDLRLRPTLANLGLAKYFEVIVASAELGEPKPSPTLFHHVAERLRLSPSEILHVGDSVREDLEGARGAGFQAQLIRQEPELAGIRTCLTVLVDKITGLP